jgi:hypothetical protein
LKKNSRTPNDAWVVRSEGSRDGEIDKGCSEIRNSQHLFYLRVLLLLVYVVGRQGPFE